MLLLLGNGKILLKIRYHWKDFWQPLFADGDSSGDGTLAKDANHIYHSSYTAP